jgi:hypothetical protein
MQATRACTHTHTCEQAQPLFVETQGVDAAVVRFEGAQQVPGLRQLTLYLRSEHMCTACGCM